METIVKILRKSDLPAVIERWKSAAAIILAPVRKGNLIDIVPVQSCDEIAFDALLSAQSAKKTAFPRVEKILEYTVNKQTVDHIEVDPERAPETILFGIRPCDASGFRSLSAIFGEGEADRFYFSKYEKTSLVTIACSTADEYCFCTSVGGGPGNVTGSDLQLTLTGGDEYLFEILTEKGLKLASCLEGLLHDPTPGIDKQQYLANVPEAFKLDSAISGVTSSFGNAELWIEQSLRCIGCGACAFVCPTCACFDIQDEHNTKHGVRLKLWDSCGFSLFTLHTSGHNPREVQSQRWRQRLMHKFSYMPEQFGLAGCEGCGRCSRACPVDMNIKEHLTTIAAL